MTTSKNFMNELNNLNSSIGVGSTIAKKYDYESANISKKEQKSLRIKVRKQVESIYFAEKIELETLKKFAALQESILIVCTKEKKKFNELAVANVYPNFEKLSNEDKKIVSDNHKKFISMLTEKKATEKKQATETTK